MNGILFIRYNTAVASASHVSKNSLRVFAYKVRPERNAFSNICHVIFSPTTQFKAELSNFLVSYYKKINIMKNKLFMKKWWPRK